MLMIPLWAVLAFAAALTATAIPLIQEKFRADGFALAFWNKAVDCALFLPFVIYFGVPQNATFYLATIVTAVLFSVSDVMYFRAIPVIGSGMMTRLLPSSVLFTFLLWFVIEPQQINTYLEHPLKGAAIMLVLALFVVLGFYLRRCKFSWQGIRVIWPIIIFASVGPVFSKIALDHAGDQISHVQAPILYLFFQALLMLVCMGGYAAVKKPISKTVFLDKQNIRTAIIMGLSMAVILILKMKAMELADNPGLASMVFFTDALWVMLFYKLRGKREDANIWAGLGIVACAAAIVLIKSLH